MSSGGEVARSHALGSYGEETLEVDKCVFCGAPCLFLFIVGPELYLDDAPSSFSHVCLFKGKKKTQMLLVYHR